MSRKVIQVAMNGVTGRMGYNQHLVRSVLSLRDQGGVTLKEDRKSTRLNSSHI